MVMGLPLPNLDDKTFEDLVREARALIPRYAPEWTDHNLHDPGITMMELFAWLAEMQNYRINRVSDANYRAFLKLLGLQPHPVRPARADVTVSGVVAAQVLERGTRLIAASGEQQIVFELEQEFTLLPLALKSIICRATGKVSEKIQANAKDDISFAPFGEPSVVGATLELGFDSHLPGAEIQLFFDLYEDDLSPLEEGESHPSGRLVWECLTGGSWEPLAIKQDASVSLTRSGRVIFSWPPEMDQTGGCYWIRARLAEGFYEIPPLINAVLLNTLSALQVESVREEHSGSGFPGQILELKKTHMIPGSLTVELRGDDQPWHLVDDFDASGPDHRHYCFDPASGKVTFGNGLNGLIPGPQQIIRLLYRITQAENGNLASGQLFAIAGNDRLVGTNLLPARGGAAAESPEEARERAKKDLRTIFRAVTAADYEELALKTPGVRVARATAIPGFHPEHPCLDLPGTVTVVVVPEARPAVCCPQPGKGFLQTVFDYLDPRRLVTVDLHLVGPQYVTVAVACTIHPLKNSSPEELQIRVREGLKRFLNPFSGGPEKRGWPFGRPIYPSEIYQLLDGIDGVDYARDVVLSAEGYAGQDGVIRIPRTALAVSGDHNVEIR